METRYTVLIYDDFSLGSLSLSAFAASLFRLSVRRSVVRMVVLVVSLAVAVPASAADEGTAPAAASSLEELAFVLGTFFPQVDGVVTNVQESGVEIDRGSNQGVRPGLVLNVSRVGAPFRHPLTGVILGASETAIGVLVIESATNDHAVGRFIGGPAAPASAEAPSGASSGQLSKQTSEQASTFTSNQSSQSTSGQLSEPVRVGDRVYLGEEPLPIVLASTAVSQVVSDRFRAALEGTGRFHLLPFTPSTPVPALIADSFVSSAEIERKASPLAAAARARGADYLMVFDARLHPVGAMGAVLILETRGGRTVDAVQVPLHVSPDELPVSPPTAPAEPSPSSLPGSPPGSHPGSRNHPFLQMTETHDGGPIDGADHPTVAEKVSDLKELFSSRSQLLYYAVPQAFGTERGRGNWNGS
jgi:hypothetical protein